MKLSINQGPVVSGSNLGFIIPVDHCKELSCFLLGWYKELPESIAERIKIITVNPSLLAKSKRVTIKVILGGSFPHQTQGGGEEPLLWENYLIETLFNYSPDFPSPLSHEGNLKGSLNRSLLLALNNEIDTHQDLLDKLKTLAFLMKNAQN